MAHSVAAPVSQAGTFSHKFSHSRFVVKTQSGRMTHRIEQNGLTSEFPVAFAIGSGRVGQSFAVAIGQHLYESPISWFSQRARWDVSPGYERQPAPDFDRRLEPECFGCHTAGSVASNPSVQPISCERCHAKSVSHFTDPAHLPVAERDRVCEGCHLQGEARILAPGSKWTDSNPLFTTYVSSVPSPGLRVVSQVEQLALSKCALTSPGKVWCGACHNPHGPVISVQQVCTGCHTGQLSVKHTFYSGTCVACHMPRQQTPEVAHTAYTDHRIQIPGQGDPEPAHAPRNLYAWREPPANLRERNLGLAYVYAGQREASTDWVQKGFALLLPLPIKDQEVFSAIGSVLMQKQRPQEAVSMYRESARLNPESAEVAYNFALAKMAAGDTAGAVSQLELAISLDSSYERSWLLLTTIYTQLGDKASRAATIKRYLRLVPQSLAFRSLQKQTTPP